MAPPVNVRISCRGEPAVAAGSSSPEVLVSSEMTAFSGSSAPITCTQFATSSGPDGSSGPAAGAGAGLGVRGDEVGESVHLDALGDHAAWLARVGEERDRCTCAGDNEMLGPFELGLRGLGEIAELVHDRHSLTASVPRRESLDERGGTGSGGDGGAAGDPPGEAVDPVGQRLDVGFKWGVVLLVVGLVVADHIDQRGVAAAGVVQVGQPVTHAGTEVQQGGGGLPGHPGVAFGGTSHHALEQAQHPEHLGDFVEGGDEVHLGGSGVGEAHLYARAPSRVVISAWAPVVIVVRPFQWSMYSSRSGSTPVRSTAGTASVTAFRSANGTSRVAECASRGYSRTVTSVANAKAPSEPMMSWVRS